eukprot:scaffold32.g3821.t1
MLRGYERTLAWALAHGKFMLFILAATIALNLYLYTVVPKGFFPQQDTGQLMGFFRVDQGTSFQAQLSKLELFRKTILADPAVQSMTGHAGGRGGSNSSFMQIQLKPLNERKVSADVVINRLRGQLQKVPGARMFLVAQQDVRIGGRQSSSGSYDYTLMAGDLPLLRTWAPKVQQAMAQLPQLTDVDVDAEDKGHQVDLIIDRDAAKRLGVDMATVAAVLNNSYSQRQVSVIYRPLNQYHVVLGVAPRYAEEVASLRQMEVITATGARVPLTAFARLAVANAPLSVEHQGLLAAETISFSLAPDVSLSQANGAIETAVGRLGLPSDQITAGFQGTAAALQKTLATQPWLILAALVTMYLVLGILYEDLIHPLTILSTLPLAGVGALLALLLVRTEFTLIALIGVFLLIGIVKKNAIMMVDFAIEAQKKFGMTPRDAIFQACLIRFRPIMMTSFAAMLGALPLILASGAGAEIRQPLGITIAALAQNYFQLRVLDEEKRLLEATVQAYQKSLQLTQHRYDAGVAAKADVAVASTQLENARAQWLDMDWRRGQYEHAIAALIGLPPAKFTLAPTLFDQTMPLIPVGLPSDLLERRPDVAAAERRAAAANARIGVAQAAYFPQLTLSATGGFRSGEFSSWLTAPARFWSLGPTLAATLFDGGARQAQLAQARAAFDAEAAAYRQSVLTALREVEDCLIQLRVLGQEQAVQARALAAARESLRLTRNQYQQGLIDYLNVAVVETTALNTERSAITLMGNRLMASVQLIAALGGGWDGLVP